MRKSKGISRMTALSVVCALAAVILSPGVSIQAGAAKAASFRVKLSKKKMTLSVGRSSSVKVKGKKIKSVSWKSSNCRVAAVKKKGSQKAVVTGKRSGKAKVKAVVKIKNQKKKVLTCTVTVKNQDQKKETIPPASAAPAASATPVSSVEVSSTPAEASATPSESIPMATALPTLQPLDTIPREELAECSYPMIFADVPDPYICRKGDTYYMVSTTMFLNPGVPVAKSTDLVHWQMVGYVYDVLADDDYGNMEQGKDMYSHGSWAASLEYNEDTDLFYVCVNTRDEGCFFFTTDDIEGGTWKRYKAQNAYHDSGMLFEDGKMYVFSSYGQCDMAQVELVEDEDGDGVGTAVQIGKSKTTIKSEKFSGIEGWHSYHIGDYYYLLAIGSPIGKWFRTQICYRTDDLLNGEWEEQVVYSGSSGGYSQQGLAQGGLIDTVYGEWYGYLFQDHESVGRCPSVIEVNWDYTDENGIRYKDWPMMGTYDENGVFHASTSDDPIRIHLKDSGTENYFWGDDNFSYQEGEMLKPVWQWNHNPDPANWSVTERPGYYRIRSGRLAQNVYGAINSLTQRVYGPRCVSETKVSAAGLKPGDYAGLCAFQDSYGIVGVTCDDEGNKYIVQGQGAFDEQEDGYYNKVPVKENERVSEPLTADEVSLKIEYDFSYTSTKIADLAKFYYSLDDGQTWTEIGKQLRITNNYQTVFMGARSYLFMYSTEQTGGYADFDHYKIYH